MPFPPISTLFSLYGSHVSGNDSQAGTGTIPSALSQRLPLLNYSSTCYLIGQGTPQEGMPLHSVFDEISAFLKQHTFLQLSLRPVHTCSPDTTREWMEAYQKLVHALRPFQEEGYCQQIVSRIRIFPLLFFPQAHNVEEGRAFLAYLNKNFFLPSIILPRDGAAAFQSLHAPDIPTEWERIYLTDSATFDPETILETLVANTLLDDLLEENRQTSIGREPLCRGILILDGKGHVRTCFRHDGTDLTLRTDGSRTEPLSPEESDSLSSEPGGAECASCLQGLLEKTEESFRLNQRWDSWREVCEGAAGQLRRIGRNDSALRLCEMCIQGMPAREVPTHLRVQRALLLYENGELEKAMTELKAARRADPDSPAIRFYMGLCEFGWRDYIEAADRFREAVELGLQGPMKQEAEYLRGESHYHLQEHDDALDALRKAEEQGREDSPLFFYKGLSLLGKGNHEDALDSLKEALSRGPAPDDLFHVFFYIAHACKEMEDYDEARAYCAKALEVNDRSQEAYNLMGFCYFKQCQYDAAIGCFEKAIEIDPGSAIDYANIGSNLREKGDLKGAVAMYRKALSLDPGIDFARENLNRLEKELK